MFIIYGENHDGDCPQNLISDWATTAMLQCCTATLIDHLKNFRL